MERGRVVNWSEMQRVWQWALSHKVEPLYAQRAGSRSSFEVARHPVLVTERSDASLASRAKTMEVMFEAVGAPSLCLAPAAALSIYATGRSKGLVLEVGHQLTSLHIADPLRRARSSKDVVMDFGGCDMDEELRLSLLRQRKVGVSRATCSRIKERLYSVPYEGGDVLFADQRKAVFTLPDGVRLELGKERMLKPLSLCFARRGLAAETPSINAPEMVAAAIQLHGGDAENQAQLWRNIVLAGGTTMMDGFAERFAKDIKGLTANRTQVIAGRSRRHLGWVGAVVVSSISTFKDISVSRAAYEEHGARAAERMRM